MGNVGPVGLLGRAIAAVGAAVLAASLFLEIAEGGDASWWEEFRRLDVVILVLAAVAILLLFASLAGAEIVCLFAVGVIGGFGLGFFLPYFIEFDFDKGLGTWLASGGSAAIVAGAALALIPALMRRRRQAQDYGFSPVETPQAHEPEPTPEPEPEPTQEPEPVASSIPAGWYPDPSGQARLRYWDGQAWTEQTQQ